MSTARRRSCLHALMDEDATLRDRPPQPYDASLTSATLRASRAIATRSFDAAFSMIWRSLGMRLTLIGVVHLSIDGSLRVDTSRVVFAVLIDSGPASVRHRVLVVVHADVPREGRVGHGTVAVRESRTVERSVAMTTEAGLMVVPTEAISFAMTL